MSYKFLSTIQAISATFTGNSVYSNSTPNRTTKLDAIGLYLSRTSDGAYPSSISADGSMYYDTRNSHIFRNDGTASMTLFDNTRNVGIGTTTDAGYKLDVNGTARINSTLSVTNSAYTGGGSFYQSANLTTVIAGGPASENITFGPSNRIFINAQQTRIAGGSLQIASTLTAGSLTATSTSMIWANGSITAGSNIARGIYTDTTLVASANNDVLVGLDISPTYTNGAFTGVSNLGLRVNGLSQITGNGTDALNIVSGGLKITRAAISFIDIINSTAGKTTFRLASDSSNFTDSFYIKSGSGANYPFVLFAGTNNFVLSGSGIPTDAGFRLDVNGTARVQYGTVERGAIFTHSNGTYAEIVLGNGSAAGVGVVEIHRNGTSAISLRSNAVLFNTSRLVTPSTFFVTGPYGGSSIGTSVRLASNTVDQGAYTATSGTQNTVVIGNSGNEIWQPSSGNATYNLFSVLPSINTSGTYAGIVRGFYYSPTLTSITGVTHRAIETVTGDVIFGSTSGNVGIGTTSPTGKLHVIGAVGNGAKITTSGYSNWNSIASFNNDSAGGLFGLDIQAYSDAGGNRIINITTNNTTGINFPNSVSVSSWSLYGCYYNTFWQDAVLYLRNTTGGLGGFKFTSVVTGVLMSILENGNVGIGTTTPAGKLQVNGSITASGAIARGTYITNTLVAAANNDVLVGLDITPTFTNGAFTGLTNLGLRVNSGVSLFSGNVVLNGTNLYFGSNLGNVVIRPVSTTNFQIFNNNTGATLFLNANGAVQIGQSNVTNWARFSATGHTIYGTTNTNFYSNGNVGIATASDNGYKLQVTGNASVSGVTLTNSLNVQTAAEVNSNEGGNDLLVYADLTSGVDVLYGGGKVKANIYTTPVTTPKTINPSSTVAFMKWYPTTSQGVFIDYVLYIDSGTEMRSGTVTIVNDTSGNAQLLDTKTADINGSTANITFAVVNNGGTMEFQVTNSGAAPAYMNILTRYIPTIF